jgi:hypothetical protein
MNTTFAPSVVDVNVADPDVTPAVTKVHVGKTLHFTNNSRKFPDIEISFVGTSPAGAKTIFDGKTSVDVPVNDEGSFIYTILHKSATGSQTSGPFAVRSCIAC